MIRSIIADDEPIAIRYLKKVLSQFGSNIEVIDEITDPDKVVPKVKKKLPDLVFLDIDFKRKDVNGLILADRIAEHFPAVMIIYISAFDEFKPAAWEGKAVVMGYIDKPFDKVRVERVVSKLAGYISTNRIEIKDKNRVLHYLNPSEIIMFEHEKNTKNTKVHCDNKVIYTTESLNSIMEKLIGSEMLFHVNRSYIANLTKIDNITTYCKSSYVIKFKNSSCEAYISKKTAQELELISK